MSKKTSAILLSLGMFAGASAQRIVNPPLPSEARPVALRLLGDGQVAIAIEVKVGAALAGREIVCAKDGSNPRLNGTPISEASAADLCRAAVAFAGTSSDAVSKMVPRLQRE